MKKQPLPDEEIRFVQDNYIALGPKVVSAKLDRSIHTVRNVADKLGLQLTKADVTRILRNAKRISHVNPAVNPKVFKQVETAAAAYVLGMIWADGHVTCPEKTSPMVSITQNEKDMKHISFALKQTGKWRFVRVKRYKLHHKPTLRASINSREIGEYLAAHGYTSKSTLSADSIIDAIPSNLQHYFYRGVFDGDGHLRLKRTPRGTIQTALTITSHFDQDWSYMIRVCKELDIEFTIVRCVHHEEKLFKTHQRASSFYIGRHLDIKIFLSYIYNGYESDRLGLKRKWLVFRELIKTKFKQGNNRYTGISFLKERGLWMCRLLPKYHGVSKCIIIGTFPTERGALEAQRAKLEELNIDPLRVRLFGKENKDPNIPILQSNYDHWDKSDALRQRDR